MAKLANKEIQLSCIRISKQHWDRKITEEDVEDLAENIADWGQIHQILVRPVGKTGRMYELISGERRYRALRANGAKTARCAIIKCNDRTARVLSLSENLKISHPSTSEWQKGIKELKDILAEDIERAEKKAARRQADLAKAASKKAKSKKSPTQQFLGATTKKSVGRPKDPQRQATKEAAKIAGVSESAARRAIKREEDLIPTAIRALQQGRISADQADRLAAMDVAVQREQLPIMIQETQKDTRERLTRQRAASQGDTAVAGRMLAQICSATASVRERVDELMAFMDGKELDYDELLSSIGPLREGNNALVDLIRFLEED
jgi:ParB/RepB/Spo0J family partition protein